MKFRLHSDFKPTGDQPNAIEKLTAGILHNERFQNLMGVTGSGKTFTIANVIQNINKPTLVISHNKTLAAQLYSEFKQFFPKNQVEYFVSYYDYYQPEAYLPTTGTYIEKDLSINEEIEKLRLKTTSSLLSGRTDVIVVASVSCLYGIGNPTEFKKNVISIKVGQSMSRTLFLKHLVQSLYTRSENDIIRGHFRIKGDIVDVFPGYSDVIYKIHFFGDEIEEIEASIPGKKDTSENYESLNIYPANIFVTSPELLNTAIEKIEKDLIIQLDFLHKNNKHLEAKRLEERTNFDLEMIKELGYCSGIENYSRYLDGRASGTRPFCLIDYFPSDYVTIIDESHVSIPQIRAIYGGDRSRKETLVEYGFRLPSAFDNRPLKFDEFQSLQNQVIFMSATPADYELELTQGDVVEQLIRPTGLLDPKIEVRPEINQIDDLVGEIHERTQKDERILITTITKRLAEELSRYLTKLNIRCRYIHSDIDTLERVEIIDHLQKGLFDVLIGVNLLREGLDIPEVSLVAVLDADKEGFLRSHRSLTQTIGRAARNVNGTAIFYASKVTNSMQKTIDETAYRREKQIAYNKKHNLKPTALQKKDSSPLSNSAIKGYFYSNDSQEVAENEFEYMGVKELEKETINTRQKMEAAAKSLDFISAAKLRDRIEELKKKKRKLKGY